MDIPATTALPSQPDAWPDTGPDAIPGAHHPAYPAALRRLHWISALILLGAAAIVLARALADDGSTEKLLTELHRAVGSCILVLTLLRLGWRLKGALPRHPALSPLLRLAAHGAHTGLYLLLFAVPLLGWSLSSAAGKPVRMAGLIPLPALLGRDRDLADDLAHWHTLAGYLLLGLVALHVAAALWHFAVRKDNVLYSMLPLGPLRRPHP